MIKVLENEIELTGYGISLDVEGENLYSKKSELQLQDL